MSLTSLVEKYREMKSDAEKWRSYVKNLEDPDNAKLRRVSGVWEFNQAIGKTDLWLETIDIKQDQMDFIDFLMGMIRADIQTDYQAVIIYYADYEDLKECQLPYPLRYYDENDSKHFVTQKDEQREVNLSKDPIVVWPWKFEKIKEAFLKLNHQSFETTKHRQKAIYFQGVNLTCVTKGFHSVLAGMGLKKGHIVAREVYDICELFPHVDTDGVKWINHHTKEMIQRVPDFRFAILYELARMKFEIENVD